MPGRERGIFQFQYGSGRGRPHRAFVPSARSADWIPHRHRRSRARTPSASLDPPREASSGSDTRGKQGGNARAARQATQAFRPMTVDPQDAAACCWPRLRVPTPRYAALPHCGSFHPFDSATSSATSRSSSGTSARRLGRLTTIPSCVVRASTTIASSSSDGFSSRCGT